MDGRKLPSILSHVDISCDECKRIDLKVREMEVVRYEHNLRLNLVTVYKTPLCHVVPLLVVVVSMSVVASSNASYTGVSGDGGGSGGVAVPILVVPMSMVASSNASCTGISGGVVAVPIVVVPMPVVAVPI